jgi:hypothetical protein
MARPDNTDLATARVIAELRQRELLLQAGREFASVANIVAGETISGSWWAHPQSNLIYWVCQDLEQHPSVAEARLLAGKVTQLWQTVWGDVAAVALSRAAWQTDGLSAAARRLLKRVDQSPVDTSTLEWHDPSEKLGDICRTLERRMLVKSEEVHTASGRHAKVLSSWDKWWAEQTTGALPGVEAARSRIETLVGVEAHRLLPWRARPAGC